MRGGYDLRSTDCVLWNPNVWSIIEWELISYHPTFALSVSRDDVSKLSQSTKCIPEKYDVTVSKYSTNSVGRLQYSRAKMKCDDLVNVEFNSRNKICRRNLRWVIETHPQCQDIQIYINSHHKTVLSEY